MPSGPLDRYFNPVARAASAPAIADPSPPAPAGPSSWPTTGPVLSGAPASTQVRAQTTSPLTFEAPASAEVPAAVTTAPARGRPRGRPRGSGRGGTAMTRPLASEGPAATTPTTTPTRGRPRGRPRGSGSGSGSGGTKRANIRPYHAPAYTQAESAGFGLLKTWEEERASRLTPGIKMLCFDPDFPITDEHLDALIALGPSVCHGIEHLSAGDEDTATGRDLTQPAVVRLAAALPNLVHLDFRGATGIRDDALQALFTHCSSLRYVGLSGDNGITGTLKGPALTALRDDPSMCPSLVELRLTDQSTWDKVLTRAIKTLSAARKHLKICVGRSRDGGPQVYWKGGKEKCAVNEYLASDVYKPPEWHRISKAYKANRGGGGGWGGRGRGRGGGGWGWRGRF